MDLGGAFFASETRGRVEIRRQLGPNVYETRGRVEIGGIGAR
jgi:hypothetical protein